MEEANGGLLDDIPFETLARNVSGVLDVLNKNQYKNSPPAKLVAVTKTVTPRVANMLKPLNITDIAENRAQIALKKLPALDPDFNLHWIGRLQTNKVKYIIDKAMLLHTLDRRDLALEIERQGDKRGVRLDCLVQVNIARETQKAGLDENDVRPFLMSIKGLQSVCVKGLMVMMPDTRDRAALTSWFRQARALFERLRDEAMDGMAMDELSMGMSGDFDIAAREGATMVRIGSALYRA